MTMTLHELTRAANNATILEAARARHKEHLLLHPAKPIEWYHCAAVQAKQAEMDGAIARVRMRRYSRLNP